MTTVKNETVNAEIPELYAAGAYSLIEEQVGKEMEATEFLYEEMKGQEFYRELLSLREIALRG